MMSREKRNLLIPLVNEFFHLQLSREKWIWDSQVE